MSIRIETDKYFLCPCCEEIKTGKEKVYIKNYKEGTKYEDNCTYCGSRYRIEIGKDPKVTPITGGGEAYFVLLKLNIGYEPFYFVRRDILDQSDLDNLEQMYNEDISLDDLLESYAVCYKGDAEPENLVTVVKAVKDNEKGYYIHDYDLVRLYFPEIMECVKKPIAYSAMNKNITLKASFGPSDSVINGIIPK